MGEEIAVLGAGGSGQTIAADLTLAGFDVKLYEEPRFKEKLQDISRQGGVEITGALGQRFAKISKVTTEIGEALEGAKIILVAVGASRHEEIAELCVPYLEDGQTIVIGPDNAGSLVFANILKKKRAKCDVSIAGMERGYYACRLIGPATVLVALPRGIKRISAFPARDTNKVISRLSELRGIYDFAAGTNVLEMALAGPNIVIHLAASLLNAGAVEQSGGDYYLYRQGITPFVLKCVHAVERERLALFEVLGYKTNLVSGFLEKVAKQTEFPELEMFRGLIGPTSMQHRYITEEASTGQALMISLAEMINVPVPVTKALITIASVINQTDYLREGRTVQKLGLSGLSVTELNKFLSEGEN